MERENGAAARVAADARTLRLDHVASPSFDPAATHRFYADILGARIAVALSGTTDSGQPWLVVEYGLGDTHLAFLTYEGMLAPTGGDLPDDIRHVAFNVQDASELARRQAAFEAAGVRYRIEHHGQDDPHLYAFDPNGLVLEFALPWERTAAVAEEGSAILKAWIERAATR